MKLTLYYGLLLLALLSPVVMVCLGIHLAPWISLYALIAGSLGLIGYGLVLYFIKVSFPGKKWMIAISLMSGLGWLVIQLYLLSEWNGS